MAKLTLLDVAKLNGNDTVVGLIEENLSFAPEVSRFPFRQIKGTSYRTVTRTGFPSVSFRSANEGVTPSKSTFKNSLVECFILAAQVEVDKAVGMANEDGMAALEMIESNGVMRQALIELGSQIWHGVSVDSKGFPGIKAATPSTATIYLTSGGSDANVQSSAYFVKYGNQDVTLIGGNNTTFNLGDFRDQTLYDAASLAYEGRTAGLTAWTGLQIGNLNCVGRIANIGQDSETGDLLTDAKIAQLLQKFPVGYRPDEIWMNRRSGGQLQRSRTVVINSGPASKAGANLEAVAPWPDSAFGIPIQITDSILSTEAVE
ncbi:MAG TPA: hypothetical protein VNT99_08275 [Methylomirabilota bacterium]|nr:hypothetical protein [Methylomirabilota bacterium]